MSGFSTDLEFILTRHDKLSKSNTKKTEYVDALERVIVECNDYLNRTGDVLVHDAIYDTCLGYLQELNPLSPVLTRIWSVDDMNEPFNTDLDRHLTQYPMLSIQTIKNLKDKPLRSFKYALPMEGVALNVSGKLNGHSVRMVYKKGVLTKAHMRGRHNNGKNITAQLKQLVGATNKQLSKHDVIEVRGEIVLSFDNLALLRKQNTNIRTTFSGAAFLLKELNPEKLGLLTFVAYDLLGYGVFDTLTEKFEALTQLGFQVPFHRIIQTGNSSLLSDIPNILTSMEEETATYPFALDGLVLTVDDVGLQKQMSYGDMYTYWNIALKLGRWQQNNYVGAIKQIDWVNKNGVLYPFATLTDAVTVASGEQIQKIPLYYPFYIMILEAYPGQPLHFKYSGELGLIPTLPNGMWLPPLI